MFSGSRGIGYFVSSAVILLALLGAGCAHRYYDPDYRDYQRWNSSETVYYQHWQRENYERRDYRHLSEKDQQRYWEWRHRQDHDRDRDHDRDHDWR